jgi:hypothetical protein
MPTRIEMERKRELMAFVDELDADADIRYRVRNFKKVIISESEMKTREDAVDEQSTNKKQDKHTPNKSGGEDEVSPVPINFITLKLNKVQLTYFLRRIGEDSKKDLLNIPETKLVLKDLLFRNSVVCDDAHLHIYAWDVKRCCGRVKEIFTKWSYKEPQDYMYNIHAYIHALLNIYRYIYIYIHVCMKYMYIYTCACVCISMIDTCNGFAS